MAGGTDKAHSPLKNTFLKEAPKADETAAAANTITRTAVTATSTTDKVTSIVLKFGAKIENPTDFSLLTISGARPETATPAKCIPTYRNMVRFVGTKRWIVYHGCPCQKQAIALHRLKSIHMMKARHILSVAGAAVLALGSQTALAQDSGEMPDTGDSLTVLPAAWTLEACIGYALENNISIQQSRINAESSAVDLKTAKAALFPSLSFSTSHSVINRPYQESSSTVSGTEILYTDANTSYTGNYGLDARWTIYNGGLNRKTIEQEKLNTRISGLEVESTSNSIEESIVQMYIQILYAEESVRINTSTLDLSIAQCDRGKELFNAGSISKADYAQLQSQVSSDRYQLVSSQSTLQDYKLQLKQLLELEQDNEMEIVTPDIPDGKVLALIPDKKAIFESALSTRPEIESSRLSMEVSGLNIAIAKAGYLPSLSLSAGIGTNHTTGTDFTFTQQIRNGWNNSVGLTLSVPIFSNRQNKSAVEKAQLQYRYSEMDLRQAHKDLYKTIESLWLDAVSAQAQFSAAKEKLESCRISYELVDEQFSLGMKNTVELLTEKNNMLSAQQEMLQAKYMAILNSTLLRFYGGEELSL